MLPQPILSRNRMVLRWRLQSRIQVLLPGRRHSLWCQILWHLRWWTRFLVMLQFSGKRALRHSMTISSLRRLRAGNLFTHLARALQSCSIILAMLISSRGTILVRCWIMRELWKWILPTRMLATIWISRAISCRTRLSQCLSSFWRLLLGTSAGCLIRTLGLGYSSYSWL